MVGFFNKKTARKGGLLRRSYDDLFSACAYQTADNGQFFACPRGCNTTIPVFSRAIARTDTTPTVFSVVLFRAVHAFASSKKLMLKTNLNIILFIC